MAHNKKTTLTIPENLLSHATQLSPTNKAFAIRAITSAFTKSDQCTVDFIAGMPAQDKVVNLPFDCSSPENKIFLRTCRGIAKAISPRRSVSKLISAALFWNLHRNDQSNSTPKAA